MKSLLMVSAMACALVASQAAQAGVQFLGTSAQAAAYAEAWNGNSSDDPKVDNPFVTKTATKLGKAKKGIEASPSAHAKFGGAEARDDETASIALVNKFEANIAFAGSVSADVADTAKKNASAEAGGAASEAYYAFKATSAEHLTVDFDVSSDFDVAGAVYNFFVVGATAKGNPFSYQADIGADDSGTFWLTLPKGKYTAGVVVEQPDFISASKGESFSGHYSGDFNLTLSAVPETSTWVMSLAGFAALGGLAMRRRRSALA